MNDKVRILIPELSSLHHNYGSQAIVMPLMEHLRAHFDAEFVIALATGSLHEEELLAEEIGFSVIPLPHPLALLAQRSLLARIALLVIGHFFRKDWLTANPDSRVQRYLDAVRDADVLIDAGGIQFNEVPDFKQKWINYIHTVNPQALAARHGKLFLKFTKSYGPFLTSIYGLAVHHQLNKLRVILVRSGSNVDRMRAMGLKAPVHEFPDISVLVEPESKSWAEEYLAQRGIDTSKPIVGLSPSAVFLELGKGRPGALFGAAFDELWRELVRYFGQEGQQVVFLPHSIGDCNDEKSCDLALSRKLCREFRGGKDVVLLSDTNLTYRQVRAIIGIFSFYVTSRYHALSSALCMQTPVVSLSWHMKYQDLQSLFGCSFVNIQCDRTSSAQALSAIKSAFERRKEVDRTCLAEKHRHAADLALRSIQLVAEEIRKYLRSQRAFTEGVNNWRTVVKESEGQATPDSVLMRLIKSRRSIRGFDGRAIPHEVLLSIVEAGIWAPTGCNNQELRFLILEDVNDVAEFIPFKPFLKGCAAVVLVFCDMSLPMSRQIYRDTISERHLPYIDTGLALANMVLWAKSIGIDSCILNLSKYHLRHDLDGGRLSRLTPLNLMERVRRKLHMHTGLQKSFEFYLRQKLHIPGHLHIMSGVAFGYGRRQPNIHKASHGGRPIMRAPLEFYLVKGGR